MRRTRLDNLNIHFGIDFKRLQDYADATGAATSKRSQAMSLAFSGNSTDKSGRGANSYRLESVLGIISGESNITIPPRCSWSKFIYSLQRQQQINPRLALSLSLKGQTAGTNLDSSEKFSLGGANAVRAYPSGEASGDIGWQFTGELHWSLPMFRQSGPMQAILFYDAGGSQIDKNPAMEGINNRHLAAVGVGLNYILSANSSIKAFYAWKAGSEAATSDTDKNGRLWLQCAKNF